MLIINQNGAICNRSRSSSSLFGAPKMALRPIPRGKMRISATLLFLETFETYALLERRRIKKINVLVVLVACFKLVSGFYFVTICYILLQLETSV